MNVGTFSKIHNFGMCKSVHANAGNIIQLKKKIGVTEKMRIYLVI